MVDDSGESAEQRLYDAATRWDVDSGYGPADMIDAACRALVDGLDSPALRELAGTSARDSSWDIRELVRTALDELRIPRPGAVPTGYAVAAGGGTTRRPGVDSLRLEVRPAQSPAGGDFQVLVHVNGAEMTSAGAGLGMDPYDLLVPTSGLAAADRPRTVPIARCTCGVYGCASTDVTITRDGDRVHWEWSKEVPMHRAVTFAATGYDAELARVAADHSWETPARTAGRLVLTGIDRERLLGHGLRADWVAHSYGDDDTFRIALGLDDDYQIFVDIPVRGRGPEELAREVCATLARPPARWRATWHAIKPTLTGPPKIAGRSWRPFRYR
ncbi:hypothetical protein [Polymorphospora sp. A560]|uniref:hypothetical protein n=1 Tax=Polymorphospora sp. A560 TaxID=3040203 RepID=UPI0038912A0F